MEIIWIAVAYILGLGASYIGLPPLVGYLVGGFILGEWGIGAGPIIHIIMEIGVLLLLFSIGLKLDPKSLLNLEVLGVGASHLIVVGTGAGHPLIFDSRYCLVTCYFSGAWPRFFQYGFCS